MATDGPGTRAGRANIRGARDLVPLDGSTLDALPSACRRCLFWELGHARPDRRKPRTDELAGDPARHKDAWVGAVGVESGPPGRVVQVDGVTVGFAVFAPARSFSPRKRPAPMVSSDALLLSTIWVEPDWRDRRVGRHLLQAAIKDAKRLGLEAVEVYGDRRYHEGDCVLPTQWLLAEGFEVHREHPRYPLLRLEVRRTLRWAESLESALDEVRERLPRPAPAPRQVPRAPATADGPRSPGDPSR